MVSCEEFNKSSNTLYPPSQSNAMTFSTILIHKTDIDTAALPCYNDPMEKNIKQAIAAFELPQFNTLPNMGLYLEQTVKYINQCLAPLGCVEVTGSMIRNYVKMGLVANPEKKMYYASHIAHLMPIVVLKQVVPLEQISCMFRLQKQVYSDQVAYDYFCRELKNILDYRFGLKDSVDDLGVSQTMEKEMLRSAVTAVSHVIFLNACFRIVQSQEQKDF